MQRLFVLFFLLFFFSTPVFAQDESEEKCGVADVNARVNELIAAYQDAQDDAGDRDTALELAERLRDDIDGLIETCQTIASGGDVAASDPGDGSIEHPFAFGTLVDSRAGFSIQVTGFIKPADRIIFNENYFNDRPGPGEVYVIVEIEIQCNADSQRCETDYVDYELAGDQGTIYEFPYVVYSNDLEVSVLGGGSGTGGLVFLVKADDTNLRLLYRPNMFDNDVIALAVEPSPESGVQITATSNLNVRSGPSTNYGVVDSLPASTPIIATGRNGDGSWVQISIGWVFTELLTFDGDIMGLPVTSE